MRPNILTHTLKKEWKNKLKSEGIKCEQERSIKTSLKNLIK